MKNLLSILVSLLIVTACGESDRFASLAEDQALLEASQEPEYKEGIQALANEGVEVKISSKNRQAVNVVDTVGENNLKTAKTAVTHIVVPGEVVLVKGKDSEKDKASVAQTVQISAEKTAVVDQQAVDLGPELNILVYLDKRTEGSCSSYLKRNRKAFLESISDYNWNISFAYYADPSFAGFLPLENRDGRALYKKRYHLSKAEDSNEEAGSLIQNTLTLGPVNSTNGDRGPMLHHVRKASDPLAGLSHILNSYENKSAKTVVLFFGNQFPYYSTSDWNDFYSKHSGVSLVALSYRSGNVSNFIHILEKKQYDFTYVSGCGSSLSAIQEVISK